ncbi:MAG: flagellar motor protein MotB [Betaproteobacteria bacterium RIFCSPLOWO2_12_61_14]|nr:MAG: flagellar motor protein MotB [Betaproteobacteria bacterium RIFCSPLOWO2_12_61_14]
MKRIAKTAGTLGLMGCAVMNSPLAVADDSGWYAGANIGQSRAKIDDARITAQMLVAPTTSVSIIDDNRDTSYKLFGGYRYNKNVAVEAGYFDLGQFGFTATTAPAGTLTGKIKLKGLNLDAVGTLPLTEKFSALGRLGLNYAQTRDSFIGTGAATVLNPNPSKNQINYKLGAGLQYDLTQSLGMRVEAERYRINDAVGNRGDVDMYSLGLVYRFGVEKPAPAPRAAEPEPVAAPKPVVVAPPPPPRKVVFSADSSVDSLFDFGKAIVKPTGKQALDRFAADLKGADYEVITVTGHTDRIGSRKYNQKLSERRAEMVKAYLVESAGIPASKIKTRGVDGAEPVTKPGECKSKKGARATKQLIACLAPDRRVEVEVIATRTSE